MTNDKKYAVLIWKEINGEKRPMKPIYREANTIREAEQIVYSQLIQSKHDLRYEIITKRTVKKEEMRY